MCILHKRNIRKNYCRSNVTVSVQFEHKSCKIPTADLYIWQKELQITFQSFVYFFNKATSYFQRSSNFLIIRNLVASSVFWKLGLIRQVNLDKKLCCQLNTQLYTVPYSVYFVYFLTSRVILRFKIFYKILYEIICNVYVSIFHLYTYVKTCFVQRTENCSKRTYIFVSDCTQRRELFI